MFLNEFPGCCSAQVWAHFGGGHNGESCNTTQEAIIHFFLKEFVDRGDIYNCAVLFACPTTSQPQVIEALRIIGFYESRNGARDRDPEHWEGGFRLCPMFLCTNELTNKKIAELKTLVKDYKPTKNVFKKDIFNFDDF